VRKSGDANIWKKMLVVIVADGRTKVDEGTLKYLAELGVYSEDLMYSTLDTVKDVNDAYVRENGSNGHRRRWCSLHALKWR
jgi:hypothetical protein